MPTTMKRALGLCVGLCLGLTSACVQVDVELIANRSTLSQRLPPIKPPISLDELKKLHTQKSCDRLDVPKERQETPAWCWAASTRMVMEFHNKKHNKKTDPQCEIARKTFGSLLNGANCCDDEISSPCIRGYWPNRALDYYQFNYQWIDGALDDWDALRGEICSIGPFISVIEWDGGGKHSFIVKGYAPESEDTRLKKTVEVYDPFLNDPQDMTFEEFVGDSPRQQYKYHKFSHHLNFVQIQPKTED